jgi:predicted CopG family antitoxin
MNTRRTITITNEAFQKLRKKGIFGESYLDLILRLVETGEFKGEIENE